MESGCEGVKSTFGVGKSLVALPEVCTELFANINNILCPSGGGDCAGACAGGVKFDFAKPDNQLTVEPDILCFE
eukprot:14528449-Ditylum_brightwellii.AAC.1